MRFWKRFITKLVAIRPRFVCVRPIGDAELTTEAQRHRGKAYFRLAYGTARRNHRPRKGHFVVGAGF